MTSIIKPFPPQIYRIFVCRLTSVLLVFAELLPSLPPDELENIVCVSTPALQLCKFVIGEPVLLEVQGQSFIKIIWTCTDKSITSVLVSKEGNFLLSSKHFHRAMH